MILTGGCQDHNTWLGSRNYVGGRFEFITRGGVPLYAPERWQHPPTKVDYEAYPKGKSTLN